MPIKATLSDEIKTAMRARDSLALDALRYLLSLIRNFEIDAHRDATDEEIISIIQKETKRRREGIEQFEKAGRAQTVEEETKKLEILQRFLPKQMSAEEIAVEVKKIVDALPVKDVPSAMKAVMAQLKGKADGKVVADLVKKVLA